MARIAHLEHSNPRTADNRRELIERLAGARNALQKLDIDLEAVTRL